ncbi:MAG: D-glycerate dehydrogenase, partial [Rhodospirillaceae bacterium]|nr:D-glycerate dehydrogenase [Rhodospirillaceae bacterium]
MPQHKPVVTVTRTLPDVVETRMMELFEARLNASDVPMTSDEIIAAVEGANVLVPTVTDKIDSGLIDRLPDSVKLIANFGVGVNHIDLEAANARKIAVTNTPGVLTDDTADMTVCLLLAASRRLAEGDRLVRSGKWEGWSPTFMIGHRISGKRLGVIGMGRIGQATAEKVINSLGMKVVFFNRSPVRDLSFRAVQLETLAEVLKCADVVSIHAPGGTKEPILKREHFAMMKKTAFLINTARGDVVDQRALINALK